MKHSHFLFTPNNFFLYSSCKSYDDLSLIFFILLVQKNNDGNHMYIPTHTTLSIYTLCYTYTYHKYLAQIRILPYSYITTTFHTHTIFLLHTYRYYQINFQSVIKLPGFASALKDQNLDLTDFRFFWPPKMNSTNSKQQRGRNGDGNNNKVYLNITDSFYHLVNFRKR